MRLKWFKEDDFRKFFVYEYLSFFKDSLLKITGDINTLY